MLSKIISVFTHKRVQTIAPPLYLTKEKTRLRNLIEEEKSDIECAEMILEKAYSPEQVKLFADFLETKKRAGAYFSKQI